MTAKVGATARDSQSAAPNGFGAVIGISPIAIDAVASLETHDV